MKKNLKEYVIVFIVIVGLILLIPGLRFSILSLFEGDIKVENNNYQYKINYYDGGTYYILLYKNYVKVLNEYNWTCITAPCPEPYIGKWYRKGINKEDRKVLEELSDKYSNETINKNNLTEEQQNIINKVLEKDLK